jgi:hypothetical protein
MIGPNSEAMTLRQLLAQVPDGLPVRQEMMGKIFLSMDKVKSAQ